MTMIQIVVDIVPLFILTNISDLRKQKCIHYHKMTDTSSHYEQMKDFMASEILMSAVEDRKLQCVDDTANSIDDTTG